MKKIDKEKLSLAGEYAVASELCRRNIYAQLTLGTRKRTDILTDTPTTVRIEVKAKQIDRWACKGIFGEDSILVFVDFQDKVENQRPDFYVLSHSDWGNFVRRRYSNDISRGRLKLDSQNIPIWPSTKEGGKIYKGVDVFPIDVTEHKECWKKIENLCMRKDIN